MAWLAVDKDGKETIFEELPRRTKVYWEPATFGEGEWMEFTHYVILPKGSIYKLIGKELTWEDEPIEFK